VNKLTRRGWIRPGAKSGPHLIRWTYNHTGEEIASGLIVANMEGKCGGWMRILIGGLDQWIDLATQPRHFGGRQWYFECPVTHRHCSVLWKPSGARFGSRSWTYSSSAAGMAPIRLNHGPCTQTQFDMTIRLELVEASPANHKEVILASKEKAAIFQWRIACLFKQRYFGVILKKQCRRVRHAGADMWTEHVNAIEGRLTR
jgi:hypothetical protein